MMIPLIFFLSRSVQAVPIQITQQGRILTNTGSTVTGTHDVTFRIYDDTSSNLPLWTESIVISFNNGYYAAILGTDESGNPLDSEVLSLYPLYLELQLDNNSPMTPRQEITSAPYAQIAGVAESVNGGIVNASEVQINSVPVVDSNRNWLGQPITIEWSQIQNIPNSVSDGDDNTQLSESDVEHYVTNNGISLHEDTTLNGQEILTVGMDSDTLANISCSDGDIPKWDGVLGQWECALDQDSLANLNCDDGDVARWNATSSQWYCSPDIMNALNCNDGEFAQYNATQNSWICTDINGIFDQDGDGVLTWFDCDDQDPNSFSQLQDADCDGVLTSQDCDDNDTSLLAQSNDNDCDGIPTTDDCDDNDALSTIVANDADCDQFESDVDCDDNEATANPNGIEVNGDGIDNDCDGLVDNALQYTMDGVFYISVDTFQGDFNSGTGFCTQMVGQTAYIAKFGVVISGSYPAGIWQGNASGFSSSTNCNLYSSSNASHQGYGTQGDYGSCAESRHVVCTTDPSHCNSDCGEWD